MSADPCALAWFDAHRGAWSTGAPMVRDHLDKYRLSQRGLRLACSPPVAPYILEHFAHVERSFDPVARPEGYVALCIAENRTMWDMLRPQLARYRDVPARVLGYDAMIGALAFREQLAAFMGRTFLGRSVAAEQLAVVAGAGATLELLFYAIADPGDGVLVPTPSYSGFWPDLETRDGLTIVPVHCASEAGFRLTIEDLDRALDGADRPIKALLFTTPNNPLGWVYGGEEIAAIRDWCEARSIHAVFDEIYALSVFGDAPFVSVASLREELGPLVHVVWAFSKDFGASGLRCGVLLSENEAVLRAVDGLAYWAAVSGDTQHLLGQLVADTDFVDRYIAAMRARLGQTYAEVTAALDAIGVAHVPAEAGIFLICDLRPYLAEPSWAAEDQLWRRLLDEAQVNLTPGSACHIVEPGFFRLCYASETLEAVLTAIARLGRVLPAPL